MWTHGDSATKMAMLDVSGDSQCDDLLADNPFINCGRAQNIQRGLPKTLSGALRPP